MTTLDELINSARYDLVDYETGIMYTDEELIVYLNRMFEIMDSTLRMLNSELIKGRDTSFYVVHGVDYVDLSTLNSGKWTDVSRVWKGEDPIEKTQLDRLWYRKQYRSGNAAPQFWSLQDRKIYWEQNASGNTLIEGTDGKTYRCTASHTSTADDTPITGVDYADYWADYDTYTDAGDVWGLGESYVSDGENLTIEYFKTTGMKVAADNMPYNGLFNEFLREQLVLHTKAKRLGQMPQSDLVWNGAFKRVAHQEVIARDFVKKPYHIDF